MPGGAGAGASKKQKARIAAQKGKKGKSGNPAKRAAEEKAAAERAAAQPGSAFGLPDPSKGFDPADLNLPKGFDKYLGQ